MKKIALIVNFDKNNALEIATKLISMLSGKAELYTDKAGFEKLPELTYKPDEELFSICSVAAVLGGDGTIISTAKRSAPFGTILLGINIGNLGYLSTFESNNLKEATELLLSDNIPFGKRFMLRASVVTDGKEASVYHALNEIVVSRKSNSRLMDFTAYCNEKTVCAYRADGMIVATPTGSTAYSLSAGGPVISPDADTMLITPICPHMLRARSIVLPPDKIRIEYNADAELSIDGQIFKSLQSGEYIIVEKSDYVTYLACNKELNFYDILQKKL